MKTQLTKFEKASISISVTIALLILIYLKYGL